VHLLADQRSAPDLDGADAVDRSAGEIGRMPK
jgi:hypothetical protein